MSETTYNVVSAAEYLEQTANMARFGAAYWRTAMLSSMGESGPWSRDDMIRVSGIDADTLRQHLPAIFRELAEFAVSRQGIAHRDAIAGVQTHLRNAFSAVVGATARFKDSPDLAPTSKYSGDDAVYRVATRNTGVDTGYSAMIGVRLKVKQDVLDPTTDTPQGVGDSGSGDRVREQREHEQAVEACENNVDHHQPLGAGRSAPSEREHGPKQDARLEAYQREHGKRTRALRANLSAMEQRNEELLRLLKTGNRLLKQAKKNLA